MAFIELKQKERYALLEALHYYMEEATHDNVTGIAGMDRETEQYKLLSGIKKKLE